MKSRYWIACGAMLLFSTMSSQKCEESIDPFTDEKKVEFKFKDRLVFFEFKDDMVRFEFEFNFSGERDVVFEKGTPILFKFENGEILELKSDRNCQPTIENSDGISTAPGGFTFPDKTFTSYFLSFNPTEKELTIFANEGITHIRIPHVNGGYKDMEAKGWVKKKAKAIKKGAQCMLSHL